MRGMFERLRSRFTTAITSPGCFSRAFYDPGAASDTPERLRHTDGHADRQMTHMGSYIYKRQTVGRKADKQVEAKQLCAESLKRVEV